MDLRRGSSLLILALATAIACGDASAAGGKKKSVPRNLVAAAPPNLTLGKGPTRVAITLAENRSALATDPGRRLHLVVRGLRAETQPGVLYHLYLDLPPGTKPSGDDPRYLGSINFFNAHAGQPALFSFDVTDVVRNLRERRLLRPETTITIIPMDTPEASVVIGAIELVEQ
jgi:hypothetical protein